MYSRYKKRRSLRKKKGGTTKLGFLTRFKNPYLSVINKNQTKKIGNHGYSILKKSNFSILHENKSKYHKKNILVSDEEKKMKYNKIHDEKYGKGVLNIIYYASPVINHVLFHPLKLFETINGGLKIYYNTFSFGKTNDLIIGIISVCSPIIVAIFDDLLINENDINNIDNIKKIMQSLIPGIQKYTFIHHHISIFLLEEGKKIALDYKKQRRELSNITKFDSTIILESVIKNFNEIDIINSLFKGYLYSVNKKGSDINIAEEIFSNSIESAKIVIRNSFEKYRILVNYYKNDYISSDIFEDYYDINGSYVNENDSNVSENDSYRIPIKKIITNWDSVVPILLGLYNDSVKLEKLNIENNFDLNRESKNERINNLKVLPDLEHFTKTLNFNLLDLLSHLYCRGETKYLCKNKDGEYTLDIITAIVNYTFKKTNDNMNNTIKSFLSYYQQKKISVKSFYNLITIDNNEINSNFITNYI